MSDLRGVAAVAERALHPAGTARPQPDLRIVGEGHPGDRARRRRRRLAATAVVLLVCASLFGVVAFHVVLTEGQLQLDRLRAQTASEQSRNARLRLGVAELEAPGWIVAAARQQGMVPPAVVTYLSPGPPASR
jgi:cell division protein FtsL